MEVSPVREPLARAQMIGPFRFESINGRDLTPRGAKQVGLLALLLMAPRHERSREYLMDKLWSDRQSAQAANSLKGALSEIRRVLSDLSHILVSSGSMIRLLDGTVLRDIDDPDLNTETGEEFLEGVAVRDPEFVNWLRDQRMALLENSARPSKPVIWLRSNEQAPTIHEDIIRSGISHGLADWCAMQIVRSADGEPHFDLDPDTSTTPFVLDTRTAPGGNATALRMRMTEKRTGRELWSAISAIDSDPAKLIDDVPAHRAINQSVDKTLFETFSFSNASREAQYLDRGAIGAIRLIFRNQNDDLERARKQLAWNHGQDKKGIYLAWSAYGMSFLRGERNVDSQSLRDEAEELATRALELDPFNSMTLALCSYVHTYLLTSPETGLLLAQRSIEANRSNPLAWSFCSAALYTMGNTEAAFEHAQRAREIAGDGPYRYAVESFFCISATLSHRVEDAINAGEVCSLLKPDFRVPLRYLSVLYAFKGDNSRLERVLQRARRLEPDFSLEQLLEDGNYPSEILRQARVSKTTN